MPKVFPDTKTLKAEICNRLAKGESLASICSDEHTPARETVYQWLKEDGAFSDDYVRAREEQADFYAEDIINIADSEPDANKARVRIDARKWVAAKLKPRSYGDKLDLNHSGRIELSDEQLESRLAQLLGKAGAGSTAGGAGEEEEQA